MKKLIILLSIFSASLLCEPVMAASVGYKTANELFSTEKKRKFKTNRKKRRGQRTCLNKSGCKRHKLLPTKKAKCNTY